MPLDARLVQILESLRRAWPGGWTVEGLAGEVGVQPWQAAEMLGHAESLGVPLCHTGGAFQLDPARMPLFGELIELGLGTTRVGRSIVVFPRASSTNDIAWQAAQRRESDGLVVLAETQSAGRGRLGRYWLDQPGKALLFSLLLLDVPAQPGLGNRLVMAASVALVDAIRHAHDLPVAIRWPNDLYLHGRKVGGILLESRNSPAADTGARPCPRVDLVLGIGVNCNQLPSDFPPELRRRACSLAMELDRQIDRIALMRAALACLEQWVVAQSERVDSAAMLRQAYLAWMDHHCGQVRVTYDGQSVEGTIRDVDPVEGLIVQLSAGGLTHFGPAQVSLEWL